MKAAVIHAPGESPQLEEFPAPSVRPGEALLRLRASPLTDVARSMAAGRHIASPRVFPAVAGADGAGLLPDGSRVYADGSRPPYGWMAETVVVAVDRCVPVPDTLDDLTAATLPNAGLSSWLALVYRARLSRGETVLVLGATGVSGRLAVPIPKHLGAGRVVAVGRNERALEVLRGMGADAVIPLRQSEADFSESLAAENGRRRIDVILDYL